MMNEGNFDKNRSEVYKNTCKDLAVEASQLERYLSPQSALFAPTGDYIVSMVSIVSIVYMVSIVSSETNKNNKSTISTISTVLAHW